jgi:hypothetical protein
MSISQFVLLAIGDRLSYHYDDNLERYWLGQLRCDTLCLGS